MKIFAVSLVVWCGMVGHYLRAAEISHVEASPVLVELFTSEGCSSCPPADAMLQKLDASQPVPGAQLIVLSEHVDYWNHDGWKDPYSSHSLTERQSAYGHALRLDDVYTPQMIVDGVSELQVNDPRQISKVFHEAAGAPKLGVRIVSVGVEVKDQPIVRAHIEADTGSEVHNAAVFVAVALDHAESQVLAGENSGRHLKHVAVVQSLAKIGRLEKGKSFSQDFQAKLKPGQDPTNIRIVAFVQEAGPGRVLGAASQKTPVQ
jgi:hypothetical protein